MGVTHEGHSEANSGNNVFFCLFMENIQRKAAIGPRKHQLWVGKKVLLEAKAGKCFQNKRRTNHVCRPGI